MAAESRIRKAWRVSVAELDGSDIWYAATAGKARYRAWRSICEFCDIRFIDVTVRREPSSDVLLPARDPIADQLSDAETHCLLHAFGYNSNDPTKAGYRDHYYTRRDDPLLVALTDRGLMEPIDQQHPLEQLELFLSDKKRIFFVLTDLGRHVALSLVPEYAPK